MRTTDLATSAANLRDAFDDLLIAWQEASEHWNDNVSRQFCEHHLEPLGPTLKITLDSIARMSQITTGMHQDLES
jgi:hypothetical protein